MTDQEKQDKVKELIKQLAIDLQPEVTRIESSIATTQYHYADYGQMLSVIGGGKPGQTLLIAKALIEAGANETGVMNGYKIFCNM